MNALKSAALSAVLVASCLSADAQSPGGECLPTGEVQTNLEQTGWQSIGTIPFPGGLTLDGYCRGLDGVVVGHSGPDGTSCPIAPLPGMCAEPVPDNKPPA